MIKFESSAKEPIKFFTEFFSSNGFQKYHDDFVTWCYTEKKNHPDMVHLFEIDGDFIMHQTMSNGFGGTDDLKTTLTEDLEKTFTAQVQKSKKFIDEAILQYLEKYNDADKFLNFLERTLGKIIETNRKLFEEYPVCIPPIDSIVEYVRCSYSVNIRVPKNDKKEMPIPKEALKNDDEIIQYSFFGGNNIKFSFLKKLYEKFCNHFIIDELDDYEQGEEQFIAIFSSIHPEHSGFKIQFRINNYEVVHIMNSLQPYFKNFNPTTIEESKCFYKNNSEKPFKKGDLYVAINKLKRRSTNTQLQISNDVLAIVEEINKL